MKLQAKKLTCIHPVIYDGVCSECGEKIAPDSRYHKLPDIYVLSSTIGTSKIESFLLERKKLALVVDLDKTLIQSTEISNFEEAEKIISMDINHKSDYFIINLNKLYLIRVRPFVREFFELISPYYFMQVYTLSIRPYALQIVHKIDPDNKYFNQRIMTQEDSPDQKKSISDIFLSGEKMAVVIDDTPSVWMNSDGSIYKGLVQFKPFKFFPPDYKPSRHKKHQIQKLKVDVNMKAIKDHYLERMAKVMIQIHSRYYAEKPADVADIIDDMKKAVFNGCYIYFCSIWKKNDIAQKKLYIQKAEEFGGHVLSHFVPYTTHIVSNDPNDKDVVEAQNYNGIFILNYKWLFNSAYRYEKQNEMDPSYVVSYKEYVAPQVTTGTKERTEPPSDLDNEDSDSDSFEKINKKSDESDESQDSSSSSDSDK